jgi:hypothetical protein
VVQVAPAKHCALKSCVEKLAVTNVAAGSKPSIDYAQLCGSKYRQCHLQCPSLLKLATS